MRITRTGSYLKRTDMVYELLFRHKFSEKANYFLRVFIIYSKQITNSYIAFSYYQLTSKDVLNGGVRCDVIAKYELLVTHKINKHTT